MSPSLRRGLKHEGDLSMNLRLDIEHEVASASLGFTSH